jgi:Tol biopolymer transport system component
VLAGAALLALAVIVLGVYKFVRHKAAPVSFQAMNLTMLTASGKVQEAAISPDGKYLAYIVADAGVRSLWVRQLATSSSVQAIPPSDMSYGDLIFSLDSNYIYYVRHEGSFGTLYEMPVLGGTARKLVFDVDSPVAISPDGKRLAFVRGYSNQQETALVVVNLEGSTERELAKRKYPAWFERGGPSWSPDGKVIAVGASVSGQGSGRDTFSVAVFDVRDGKEQTFISKEWGTASTVAWLPDGRSLLFLGFGEGGFQIWHLAYPSGQVRRVTNDTNSYGGLSVTADGKALVTASTKSSFSFWGIRQGEWSHPHDISPGTSELDGYWGFSWMPDGRILYVSQPSGKPSLWAMNAEGSNPKELPVGVWVGLGVSACLDGKYVLFKSQGLVRVDSEGGNLKRLTTGEGHFDFEPRCSPDGQWVVYLSYPADHSTRTLWKISIEGGRPVQLRDKTTVSFAISRDGKWIACTGEVDPNQPTKLIIMPSQGGPPSKAFIAPPGSSWGGAVDWAPDGRSLTFSASQKDAYNVWTQPLAGGLAKQLTNFETGRIFSLNWSPDGKQLALARQTSTSDAMLISNFVGSEK